MEQQNQNNVSNTTFKYVSGSNVQAVWRKYGWTPPTEYRNDYAFKYNREALELNG
jgi:hypothetical protein